MKAAPNSHFVTPLAMLLLCETCTVLGIWTIRSSGCTAGRHWHIWHRVREGQGNDCEIFELRTEKCSNTKQALVHRDAGIAAELIFDLQIITETTNHPEKKEQMLFSVFLVTLCSLKSGFKCYTTL